MLSRFFFSILGSKFCGDGLPLRWKKTLSLTCRQKGASLMVIDMSEFFVIIGKALHNKFPTRGCNRSTALMIMPKTENSHPDNKNTQI